ncbi:MAG: hypothetical protein ACRC14_15065 [Paracoccaceae bacterium]
MGKPGETPVFCCVSWDVAAWAGLLAKKLQEIFGGQCDFPGSISRVSGAAIGLIAPKYGQLGYKMLRNSFMSHNIFGLSP